MPPTLGHRSARQARASRLVAMPRYRFQPRRLGRLWVTLLTVTVVFFALPVGINALLPTPGAQIEDVTLASDDEAWSVPLPLRCEVDPDAVFGKSWNCGSARVSSVEVDGIRDAHTTMRRMARAASVETAGPFLPALVPVATAESAEGHQETRRVYPTPPDGTPLLAATSDIVSMLAPIPDSESYLSLTIHGGRATDPDDLAELTRMMWQKLTGAELDDAAVAQVAHLVHDEELPSKIPDFGFEVPRPVDSVTYRPAATQVFTATQTPKERAA